MDKPGNFSFIDGLVAGSAFPYTKSNLDFYQSQAITHIISFTEIIPSAINYGEKNIFKHLHVPIGSSNIGNNAVTEIIDFINSAKKELGKVVMHCQFGQERTGIGLAIYLVELKGLTINKAIEMIQIQRPSSLQIQSSLRILYKKFS